MQPVGQSNQSNYSAPTAPSTDANAPVEKVSSLSTDAEIVEERFGEAVAVWVSIPSQIHTAVFESGSWKTVGSIEPSSIQAAAWNGKTWETVPKKEIPEGKK